MGIEREGISSEKLNSDFNSDFKAWVLCLLRTELYASSLDGFKQLRD